MPTEAVLKEQEDQGKDATGSPQHRRTVEARGAEHWE